MTSGANHLTQRQLVSVSENGITLIDAVETVGNVGTRKISLFFANDTDPDKIKYQQPVHLIETRVVGGAPRVILESDISGPLCVEFDGKPVNITPAISELGLLEGSNAALSVRNGETADTVLIWLEYHCSGQGMTAAVILDRAKPGSDLGFVKALEKGLLNADFNCSVILLNADVPLGRSDLPAEAHPYCIAESPGKGRMEVPEPDPWSSPLGMSLYYEIARHRYLENAQAVVSIDVHDLLVSDGTSTVFDQTLKADNGLISLTGEQCYPWRIPKNNPTHFGDHICIQFDSRTFKKRWCIAPEKTPQKAVWRMVRIGNMKPDQNQKGAFFRFMALRHPSASISKIVPKASLIEQPDLLNLSKKTFGYKPSRLPKLKLKNVATGRGRCAIVTTMKNEGPFILEWLAYHRAIGVDDFLVYTNECSDGTDTMLSLLQSKGLLQHRDNPYRDNGLKPQHAALQAAETEPVIVNAKWVMTIDVDEFINIKVGNGSLDDLFFAVPNANMISMTWRLFGNADIHGFKNKLILEQFTYSAPEFIRNPHQAWGFKTLFQNLGIFKKFGVHRPKGLNPQLMNHINWVNGSGKPMPTNAYRTGWRSNIHTYGYDLVSLNHYAVRSAESFLVKRDRGRVNHVNRDQGLSYWFRMNNNAVHEPSIQRMLPRLKTEFERLMSDPEIAEAHNNSVAAHRNKIDDLVSTKTYKAFFAELTSARFEKLSRLHSHFGSNVFLLGPDSIPDEIIERNLDKDFFFTVESGETTH